MLSFYKPKQPADNYQLLSLERQGAFITGLSIIGVIGITIYLFVDLAHQRYLNFTILFSLWIFYLSMLALVRAGRIPLAASLITIVGGAGYFFSAYADRIGDTGLLILPTFPILAFFLLGKHRGLIAVIVFAGAMVIAYMLHRTGIVTMAYSPQSFRDVTISFAISTLMVEYYQDLINASVRLIEERDMRVSTERDRANAIINSMNEGLFVIAPDRRVLSINPNAQQMLNTTAENAIGKQIYDIFHLMIGDKPLHPDYYPSIQTLLTGKSLHVAMDNEYYCQPNGRNIFPVTVSTNPIMNNGIINGVVVVFRDVTLDKESAKVIESEVKIRTREAEEGRARLLASINSLEIGYIMTDNALSVVMINNAALNLLASAELITAKDYPHQHYVSLYDMQSHIGERVDLLSKVKLAIEKKQIVSLKDLQFGKISLQIFISPIELQNSVIGTVILIQDVTETRIIERSKNEFLSIASHELRTPLTAIRGYTALIKTYYLPKLNDEKLSSMIEGIHSASTRLINIVNDFLNTSLLEQNRITFKKEWVEVPKMVEESLQEFAALSQQKNIFLRLEPPTQPIPKAWIDRERTKQIFVNLIGNAFKYTEQGGITCQFAFHEKYVYVRVHDTGKGIPPELQPLLFRKLQQAGRSILSRDTSHGTGLGLYISKLLAKGMQGDLYLEESSTGKGTSFLVKLPIEQDSPNTPADLTNS